MKSPKIRFSEFKEDYQSIPLKNFTSKVKRKNTDNLCDRPLTIASLEGLVDQRTYFDKPIASKDMSKYFLLKNGEFAYNKSYSRGYPVGSIKRLDKYDEGALSTLYICFSLNNNSGVDSDYLKQYFDSSCWYEKVKNICAEGARNHGLLNVIPDEFFAIEHNIAPTINEQEKVARFFNLIDKKIDIQMEKVKGFEDVKNSIISQIFTQKIRFKSKTNLNFKEWKKMLLSDVLTERKQKSSGIEEVYSVSVSKGLINQVEHLGRSFAAEDTSKYNLVKPGDVIYTKSPTGDFKWGIVKQSTIEKDVIISPLYGVFVPQNDNIGYIIDAYFSSSVRAHNYLITQIRKGAKNTINVTNAEFLNKAISLPTDEKEQELICEFIKKLNQKLDVEKEKLEIMKIIKKELLKNMFV